MGLQGRTNARLSRGHATTYAVDFDGTLCVSNYPYTGEPNLDLIEFLIKERKRGCKVILWTCRVGEVLECAVLFCKAHGLKFDAVNENLPEVVECFGENPRKIVADIYIDDRADNCGQEIPFYGKPTRGGRNTARRVQDE